MPTAHLVHGYIGAGKTTFARQLEHDLPAVRFTPDEWVATIFGDDESAIEVEVGAAVTRIEAAMTPLWIRCLELGLDVVLDMGFWTRASRDTARRAATAVGAEWKVYRVLCDDERAWQRVDRRNGDPSGSIRMVRNTFDVLKGRVEALGPDEPHVDVRT